MHRLETLEASKKQASLHVPRLRKPSMSHVINTHCQSSSHATYTSRQVRFTSLGGGGGLSGHAAGLDCRGASNHMRHHCSH
jgi:hypothetical protein